jgi:hypothetical protein
MTTPNKPFEEGLIENKQAQEEFGRQYKQWIEKHWKLFKDDIGVSKAEAIASVEQTDTEIIALEWWNKGFSAGQKAEAIGMLGGLDSLKIQNPKFKSPEGYWGRVEKEIIKISKETHNFPHYTTCHTCEDGWDMQIDFLIKELKKSSHHYPKGDEHSTATAIFAELDKLQLDGLIDTDICFKKFRTGWTTNKEVIRVLKSAEYQALKRKYLPSLTPDAKT